MNNLSNTYMYTGDTGKLLKHGAIHKAERCKCTSNCSYMIVVVNGSKIFAHEMFLVLISELLDLN